ncbi:MAG TPA: hypothetical protein VLC46_26555 [Thermoanaerobaculia bacterium]|jgi:hypothetical protein|nr:hypothetical protein [Thermoanaerobaculia bacterium]
MRNTIRTYAFAFSLIAALATTASAAPKNGDTPFEFFTRVITAVIHVLDDAKVVIPPG